jgi:hypothetical protein
MYVITSFGLIYLTSWFGNWGVWVVLIPSTLGFIIGVRYFEKLEFSDKSSQSSDFAKMAA